MNANIRNRIFNLPEGSFDKEISGEIIPPPPPPFNPPTGLTFAWELNWYGDPGVVITVNHNENNANLYGLTIATNDENNFGGEADEKWIISPGGDVSSLSGTFNHTGSKFIQGTTYYFKARYYDMTSDSYSVYSAVFESVAPTG